MNPYTMTRSEIQTALENDFGTAVFDDEPTDLLRDCLAENLWPDLSDAMGDRETVLAILQERFERSV